MSGKAISARLSPRRNINHILIDFGSPLPGTVNIFEKYGNRNSLNEFFNQLSAIEQMLRSNGHDLRFYETILHDDGDSKKYEVDFLLTKESSTNPVETKSENSRYYTSIDNFCGKYGYKGTKGIILTKGDLRITEDYIYLPLPMAIFL